MQDADILESHCVDFPLRLDLFCLTCIFLALCAHEDHSETGEQTVAFQRNGASTPCVKATPHPDFIGKAYLLIFKMNTRSFGFLRRNEMLTSWQLVPFRLQRPMPPLCYNPTIQQNSSFASLHTLSKWKHLWEEKSGKYLSSDAIMVFSSSMRRSILMLCCASLVLCSAASEAPSHPAGQKWDFDVSRRFCNVTVSY